MAGAALLVDTVLQEDAEWKHDDAEIKSAETLYRRVPNKPSYFKTQNRFNGDICFSPAAFSLTDADHIPPAGCSTQLENLMIEHEIATADLVNWDTHVVGRFKVEHVRASGGGVVAHEDAEDEILGKAHGLLRTKSPGMRPKGEWSALRNKLLEHVEYFGTDPGYSTLKPSD